MDRNVRKIIAETLFGVVLAIPMYFFTILYLRNCTYIGGYERFMIFLLIVFPFALVAVVLWQYKKGKQEADRRNERLAHHLETLNWPAKCLEEAERKLANEQAKEDK